MTTNKLPARVIHPGIILRDELEAREWTQKDFAKITGRPEKTISAIIQGKKEITPETAMEFAAAFGTSPDIWNNLQANYSLHTAMKKPVEKEIERKARIYSLVPVDELIHRGCIMAKESLNELEKQVCEFLGIASIKDTPAFEANFRVCKNKNMDRPSQIAWLRIIEKKAKAVKVSAFDIDRFKKSIGSIVKYANNAGDCAKVVEFLGKLGVKLVFEKAFKNTHIDGAVFYVDGNPVIGMTLRLDRLDNFWFTLLHELGHIILNHKTCYIDELSATDSETQELPEEKASNQWAAGTLLSNDAYRGFIDQTKPYFSRASIERFAQSQEIHPAIVIGRLQREGLISYAHLRVMLEKISPYIANVYC
jgi:HTH-type transcriptional regulator/antitoxin HigA